jgi:hypothetical protein
MPQDDLHSFDLANMKWTLISALNDESKPSARYGHGFTSAGGLLYVHGGMSGSHGPEGLVECYRQMLCEGIGHTSQGCKVKQSEILLERWERGWDRELSHLYCSHVSA